MCKGRSGTIPVNCFKLLLGSLYNSTKVIRIIGIRWISSRLIRTHVFNLISIKAYKNTIHIIHDKNKSTLTNSSTLQAHNAVSNELSKKGVGLTISTKVFWEFINVMKDIIVKTNDLCYQNRGKRQDRNKWNYTTYIHTAFIHKQHTITSRTINFMKCTLRIDQPLVQLLSSQH